VRLDAPATLTGHERTTSAAVPQLFPSFCWRRFGFPKLATTRPKKHQEFPELSETIVEINDLHKPTPS
jgi:hypothetical protein